MMLTTTEVHGHSTTLNFTLSEEGENWDECLPWVYGDEHTMMVYVWRAG